MCVPDDVHVQLWLRLVTLLVPLLLLLLLLLTLPFLMDFVCTVCVHTADRSLASS